MVLAAKVITLMKDLMLFLSTLKKVMVINSTFSPNKLSLTFLAKRFYCRKFAKSQLIENFC
jgi:hypothetical protein